MTKQENQWGPMIGVVVIVVVLAAGGYYYWMQNKDALTGNSAQMEQTGDEILNGEDKALDALKTQSTSSAYSAIEADLNATDLDSIDSDLQNAGNELGI